MIALLVAALLIYIVGSTAFFVGCRYNRAELVWTLILTFCWPACIALYAFRKREEPPRQEPETWG